MDILFIGHSLIEFFDWQKRFPEHRVSNLGIFDSYSKIIERLSSAYGFSGKYIAKRLLDAGHQVITITSSPDRENSFGGKVRAYPFNFDNIEKLAETFGSDITKIKGLSSKYLL